MPSRLWVSPPKSESSQPCGTALDLGYIPIVIRDACGAGHHEAGERAMATLEYIGDAMLTTVEGFATALRSRNAVADREHYG